MSKNNLYLLIGVLLLLLANLILLYGGYPFMAIIIGIIGFFLGKETDFESNNNLIKYFSWLVLGITSVHVLYIFLYLLYATN